MTRTRTFLGLGLIGLAIAIGATACGGDEAPAKPAPAKAAAPAPPAAPAAAAPAAAAAADAGADGGGEALPLREFQETDFSETDRSRDPFRGYEDVFMAQAKTRTTVQRQVLVDRYSLDELKIVGIVARGVPRALLVDPSGIGWVVKVGDFLGRAELVHAGGPVGGDVAVNWRVDRIRENDIVLLREDPSHPDVPATTRVIALRAADSDNAAAKK